MKGYDSVDDYVFTLQNGHCELCDGKITILFYIYWSSNTLANIVRLGVDFYTEGNTNKQLLDRVGLKKKYADTSVNIYAIHL